MSNLTKILAVTTALLLVISVTLVICNLIAIGIIIFFISMIYFATTVSVMWLDIVEKADL
jgi:hypothetical protein